MLGYLALWVDGKTLRILCVEVTYFTILYTFGASVTVSTVKNMGLAEQQNTLMVKNGFNYMQKMKHRHWYKTYIYNNSLKRLNGFGNRLPIVFDWNVTIKIRDRGLGRVKYKFRKKIILWNARNTVFVANDLLIILRGKGLQSVKVSCLIWKTRPFYTIY